MDQDNTTPVLDDLRQALEKIYGSRLAGLRLFGSRARGDATAESDYDVLVVLRGEGDTVQERQRARDAIYQICWKFDAVVMCHYVSQERYESEKSPFILNVHREGVAV